MNKCLNFNKISRFTIKQATSKPKFTLSPDDLIAIKGQKCKILAEFEAHPDVAEIHWFKNKKEIFSGKRQWIESTPTSTSLTVGEVREDDEGDYKIVIKNEAGSSEHTCKLTMDQLPEINRVERYSSTLVFDKGETVKLRLSFSGQLLLIIYFFHHRVKILKWDWLICVPWI
ncbi:unnamed protein product [Caenorhabditis angaria]|uniref:Ig-like domain-containing protein n=1 Tax=Caenorhabditis angaria TaxID=860376 RepID=A0A9P1N5G5_9PELO|nr:unnamed protein product [Caenorhabditis angaria]